MHVRTLIQIKHCSSQGRPPFSSTSRPSLPYSTSFKLSTYRNFCAQYTIKRPFVSDSAPYPHHFITKWVWEEGEGECMQKLSSLILAWPEIYWVYTFLDAYIGSASIFWVNLSKLQTLCFLANRGSNNSHIPLNICRRPLTQSVDIYSAVRMNQKADTY